MRKLLHTTLLLLPILIFPLYVNAQDLNIANTYSITDPNIADGDVIAIDQTSGEFVRASNAPDEQFFGVYVVTPRVVFRTDPTNSPIVREGDAFVNATTMGGPINQGDKIVVSPIAGKAQKSGEDATKSIGAALGDFQPSQQSVSYEGQEYQLGKVHVALKVEVEKSNITDYKSGVQTQTNNLAETLLSILTREGEDISRLLRYIIAGAVAIITVYLSFRTFGRNITKGIESIGRNPLAKVSIQSMIVLNIVLIALVTIGGVILTLIIIKF